MVEVINEYLQVLDMYYPELDGVTLFWDLVCPNCRETLHPPIRMCEMLHVVCNTCIFRIRDCPVCCRAYFSDVRVRDLEIAHDVFTFACKYPECNLTLMGDRITEHEDNCIHAIKGCPLRETNSCTWLGVRDQILEHCLDIHEHSTFASGNRSVATLDLPQANDSSVTNYYLLFFFEERFFKCVWQVNPLARVLNYCVFILDDHKLDGYDYCIEIIQPGEESIHIRGKCPPLRQDEHVDFVGEHFKQILLDDVRLRDDRTSLNYVVNVIKGEAVYV